MRVLYITNSGQIGGGNTSLLTLWSAVKSHGIEPIAVCPFNGPMVEASVAAGVDCRILPYNQPGWNNPRESVSAYLRWSRLLTQLKPDLIHANDPSGARSIAFAAWHQRIPVVCHVQFPPAPGYMDWGFKFVPSPREFIFCSQATMNQVSEEFSRACPSAVRTVIHNAVSLADFKPRSNESAIPRVGIIANLLPVKGHEDFLKMAQIITEHGTRAEYWLIGEDIHQAGHRAHLEDLTRSLGISDSVKFLGHRSDVADLMGQLDVVVCSSHVEPFGICIIEAMASERPVVGTRVGGIPEVIDDGVCGYIVPPHAPAELAMKVEALLASPDVRRQMGHAGRERVIRLFSREAQADRIVQIYKKFIDVEQPLTHTLSAS